MTHGQYHKQNDTVYLREIDTQYNYLFFSNAIKSSNVCYMGKDEEPWLVTQYINAEKFKYIHKKVAHLLWAKNCVISIDNASL